jgi:D-alanyl-D-alanine carboxypeptidase
MTTSQNGWPASESKSAIGIEAFTPNGVSFPNGVKGGDVATVLGWVAHQFHNTVEQLHAGWCWGYYYKQIQGSSTLSNHASGTAIDFNAPNHPMGRSGTFNRTQVEAIRRILNTCEGTVRWGGDYSSRKDEMHFEIVGNAASVKRVAAKLRGTQAAPAVAQLVVDGDLGEHTIKRWQQVMHTGVDGVISKPSDLVKAVQRRLKDTVDRTLEVDGYGIAQDSKRTRTIGALQRYLKVPVDEFISKDRSQTIMALQRRLNENRF